MSGNQEVFTSELNTGIIIAGAYADKVRRTVFAQLGEFVRSSKECAKEVARAVAELNTILYHIIVEKLGSSKGDAVRIRINYAYDKARNRLSWDYGSLRIEYYRRVPDEEVEAAAKRVIDEKLQEVISRFRAAEAVETSRQVERAEGSGVSAGGGVYSLTLLGESIDGGLRFAILDRSGKTIGLASIDYEAGGWFADFVYIAGGAAYRSRFRVSGGVEEYRSEPGRLLQEFLKHASIEIDPQDALNLMEEKKKSLRSIQ